MRVAIKAKPVTLKAVECYLGCRLDELEELAKDGHPWIFLASCTYIDLCAALEKGASSGNSDFKAFCSNFIFPARKAYAAASYPRSHRQLDNQLYHILRCGVTHCFSMTPDPHPSSARHLPTPRSVLLAHKKSGFTHLSCIEITDGTESYVLIAEDFVDDLRAATDLLFRAARKRTPLGSQLRTNIVTRFAAHPPLGWTEFRITKA